MILYTSQIGLENNAPEPASICVKVVLARRMFVIRRLRLLDPWRCRLSVSVGLLIKLVNFVWIHMV